MNVVAVEEHRGTVEGWTGGKQQVCAEELIKEKNFHGGSKGKQQSMVRCTEGGYSSQLLCHSILWDAFHLLVWLSFFFFFCHTVSSCGWSLAVVVSSFLSGGFCTLTSCFKWVQISWRFRSGAVHTSSSFYFIFFFFFYYSWVQELDVWQLFVK